MPRERISPSCVDNVGKKLRPGDRVLLIMAAEKKLLLAYQRGKLDRQVEEACPNGFGFHVAILRSRRVFDPSLRRRFPLGLSRSSYLRMLFPRDQDQGAYLVEITPEELNAYRDFHKLKVLTLVRERKLDLKRVNLGKHSSLEERASVYSQRIIFSRFRYLGGSRHKS